MRALQARWPNLARPRVKAANEQNRLLPERLVELSLVDCAKDGVKASVRFGHVSNDARHASWWRCKRSGSLIVDDDQFVLIARFEESQFGGGR